jgi:uncharacterized damage-inducible protein DinB
MNELTSLLRLIDQAFDKKAWHGPNLRGAIRRVTAAEASWRPSSERHSIAEVVLHAAYWKYVVRRRLLGLKRGSFALKGSNWFPRTQILSDQQWRQCVSILEEEHQLLREAIVAFPLDQLPITPASSKVSNTQLIEGIACHDVYHAGQIQLLRALQK